MHIKLLLSVFLPKPYTLCSLHLPKDSILYTVPSYNACTYMWGGVYKHRMYKHVPIKLSECTVSIHMYLYLPIWDTVLYFLSTCTLKQDFENSFLWKQLISGEIPCFPINLSAV